MEIIGGSKAHEFGSKGGSEPSNLNWLPNKECTAQNEELDALSAVDELTYVLQELL